MCDSFWNLHPQTVGLFMVELHLSETQSDALNVCILHAHCTLTAVEPQQSLLPRLCLPRTRINTQQWRRSQRQAKDRTIS